jgi:hypothetical protein
VSDKFTMPAAVLLPRTKVAQPHPWVDRATMAEYMGALDKDAIDAIDAIRMLGRVSKVIDDDVQLLYLAGIALDRMEMRHYDADPLRHTLLVDRKVVREYVVTFTVDGKPL